MSKAPNVDNEFRDALLFLDHPGNGWHSQTTTGIDRRDTNAGLNLFYLQALQAMAQLEGALDQDTAALVREVEQMKRALGRHCLVRQRGLVADAGGQQIDSPRFSQIVNALAVTTGLLEHKAARHALKMVMPVMLRST